MTGLIIAVHVIVCILLIILILIQRGRGGGLVDTFSDVESMFGTKTNAFLTRTTTILSTIFFITCLSLALISARQSKSLLDKDTASGQAAASALEKNEAKEAATSQAVPNKEEEQSKELTTDNESKDAQPKSKSPEDK